MERIAWIIDDGTRRKAPIDSSLRSLEISGFRGELLDLEWLLVSVRSSLVRFAFDCPLDQEPWSALTPALSGLRSLTELSLWSWTCISLSSLDSRREFDMGHSYEMPIKDVVGACSNLRHISLAAHDLTPELFSALPGNLTSLLVCSHREFSPLNTADVAKQVSAVKHLHALPRLVLYDPSAQGERFEELKADKAWATLRARGTEVLITPDPRILGCQCVARFPGLSSPSLKKCTAYTYPSRRRALLLPGSFLAAPLILSHSRRPT